MSYRIMIGKASGATDITELVGTVEVTENTNKAGSCTFSMIAGIAPLEVGNSVMLECDGVTYFAGYVFRLGWTQDKLIKVTAYDQLIYLKASDTKTYSNLPLEKIVQQMCEEYHLRTGELEPTGYPLGRLLYDGKKLLDIIANCISLTLRATGEMYYIKDDGGYLTMKNIRNSISYSVVEPGSLLTGYDYTQDISESANQIKLVRDNKSTGKRELFIAKDSSTIARWGMLQHYEKLDDGINPEQAKEKADALLKLKNRISQTLSLDIVGDKSIRAGHLICVRIPDAGLDKFLLCTAARHSFSNTGHTIKVDLRLV